MVRIRTIKPEFWSDEKLSPLDPIDRLVFLGLVSLADDFGRCHDNVKVIDAFVFPNCSRTVRESLANLSALGRIRRGMSCSGKPILEIVNWSKHQKVDKPQEKMALPPIHVCTKEIVDNPTVLESFANDSRIVRELVAPRPTTMDQRPTTNDQGEGPGENDSLSLVSSLSGDAPFMQSWGRWKRHRNEKLKPLGPIEEEQQLFDLSPMGPDEAKAIVDYTISRGALNLITNGDHKQKNGKPKKDLPF